MELPHLGEVCVVCNRTDYLPFRCSHCDKVVCIDHKTNHGTECPLQSVSFEASRSEGSVSKSLKKACDFCKKITLKLELVECQHCQLSHCLYHRHQVQHECRQLVEHKKSIAQEALERANRQKDALDRLRAHTKQRADLKPTQLPAQTEPLDPKKRDLAKRIRVMKIKQSARGPPNILNEDRVYFEVKFVHEPSSTLSSPLKDGKSIRIFTSPKHTIGRLIDWSADELGVTNKNHLIGVSQLVFKKRKTTSESNECETLDSQSCFSKYLNDKQLEEGDEILLTYDRDQQ